MSVVQDESLAMKNVSTLPNFPNSAEKFPCEPILASMRRWAMLAWIVMVVIMGFAGLSILVGLLQHGTTSAIDQYTREQVTAFLATILIPLIVFFGMAGFVLGYSDIAVGKEGVWCHLVASWYLLIPKQSFGAMKIYEVQYTGIKRHLKSEGLSFAICVPGLTVFHRLVGLTSGLWLTPVFLVTPDHTKYEILLKKLKEMHASETGSLS